MEQLTKDADKIICCIYKEYLERRKSGISKSKAKEFSDSFYKNVQTLSKWSDEDISDTLQELHDKAYIKRNIFEEFVLLDSAVIYMENRFKNGLDGVMDFISKIPLIP